jgi:hypothetical protein
MAASSATTVEGLLVQEGELTWREEALAVREEKARISEKALVQVSAALDVERTKVEASQQEYLNKIEAHNARGNNVLGLDKILEEKKVELDGRERDLELHTAEV